MSQVATGVDLEASVGYRLKVAAAALHTAMEEVLRPLGLNITQYSALELLAQRPGISSSELARGTFVTRQSMAVVLRTLSASGLVSRAETAPHGRVLPTRLTERGRERLGTASIAVRALEERMLGGIDRDEIAALRQLLDRCAAALRTDVSSASGVGRAE